MEGCSFLWEFLSIPAAKQSSMSFITWQLRWLSVETLHFSLYLGFLGRRITSSRRPSMSECKDHNRAASQEWKSSGVLNSRGEASFRAFMTPWCSCLLRSLRGHSRTEEWKTVIKQVLVKLFSSVYTSVGICRHLNFCPTQDHTDLINGSIVPSPSTAPKQQLYTVIWAGEETREVFLLGVLLQLWEPLACLVPGSAVLSHTSWLHEKSTWNL